MKILFIDIETTPILAWCWGLWKQNISPDHIVEPTHMLCYAAKFSGGKMVFRWWRTATFLPKLWDMLNEADVVVHYNGKTFDITHINREFLEAGMTPPSPYKQIDMLHVVRATFNFPSNKLGYVLKALNMAGKVPHEGFDLWIKCINGVRAARAKMKEYNIGDTVELEALYERLKPWIICHPNVALLNDMDPETMYCMSCASDQLQRRGYAYTAVSKFQRYQCQDCRKWQRGRKNLAERENLTTSIAK
jgi:hypothetical protein